MKILAAFTAGFLIAVGYQSKRWTGQVFNLSKTAHRWFYQ